MEESIRKLATIQTIDQINPIEGADNIEVARVLGWKVVVKKGEFQPGNKCCFFEDDSLLPEKPEFEFMRNKKFRVRTMKFNKWQQISQGLALPLNSLSVDLSNYNVGDDVTEVLGVTKWEPSCSETEKASFRSKRMSNFPYFIPKTDETRIQNLSKIIKSYNDLGFYVTEKLDGSSITIFFLKESNFGLLENYFGVCSRKFLLDKDETNSFWQVVRDKKVEEKALEYGKSFCIQGEFVGPGIQKNKYKLAERDIFIYSVFDMFNQKYLGWDEIQFFAQILGLKTVPFLGEFVLNHTTDELLEMSNGYSKLNETVLREGIVCRHVSPDKFFSFKAIQPAFLLKFNE